MQGLRQGDRVILDIESSATPMHNATLEIFEPPPTGFTYADLVELVADRLAFVPRYRQRLQKVAGGLANPVWLDDARFDLRYHIRQSGLPSPGTMAQLRELAQRIIARKLDPDRPLWEMYFIEGVERGRFAILAKSHQTLVDGAATIDLGQVLLDLDAVQRERVHDDWAPRRAPSQLSLAFDGLVHGVTDPAGAVESMTSLARRLPGAADWRQLIGGRRAPADGPLTAEPSQQRLLATIRTDLTDYRDVRRALGGTVNDVILATITGALRMWLMTRAEAVPTQAKIRALVPMSVEVGDLEPTSLGSQVVGTLLNLPIGEVSPVVRLAQVSYGLKAHHETGGAVSATRLLDVAGFAPATFHALGSRVAATAPANSFALVITNVPGPQFPLYLAGATMTESYPIQPLLPGQALAIGVTSYDGAVCYGLNADRDAVFDVDVLGQCLRDALAELVDSVSPARPRAPRGRQKAAAKTPAQAPGKAPVKRSTKGTPKRAAEQTGDDGRANR